jgi:diadenosine tetraphosphate (Ap4A) HIT family hydrolase
VIQFAEKEHFEHVHFHVVARAPGLAPELKGTAIFKLINVEEHEAPREEIRAFCERLRANPNWRRPGDQPP